MTTPQRITAFREVHRPNDTTIRYTVSGPEGGVTLALIHGWACRRTDFDAVTTFLPDEYRVIAIDLAEHGESRSGRTEWTIEEFANDIAAVFDAESARDVVVVGHSLGGAVAVEAARLLPGIVSRVVALDALHYLFLFPALDEADTEAMMTPFRTDFAGAVRGMVEAGSPPGTDPALKDAYFDKMVAVRQPGGLLSFEGLVRWDMDAALSEVEQPITLFGVRAMVSQDAIDRYGKRLDTVLVDLGSHHFHVESPQGTAELLTELITRNE